MVGSHAAKRIRMIFETDEQTRTAIQLRAVKDHVSISDVLNRVIQECLADDYAEAAQYVENGDRPPSRRGRKRKEPEADN